jgi:hypothetical protein
MDMSVCRTSPQRFVSSAERFIPDGMKFLIATSFIGAFIFDAVKKNRLLW